MFYFSHFFILVNIISLKHISGRRPITVTARILFHMTSASSFHSTFQDHLRTYKRAVLLFVFSVSESGSTAAKVTRALFSIITQTFEDKQITELICLHTVVDVLNVTTFISLMSLLRWHQVFTWFSSSVSSVAY